MDLLACGKIWGMEKSEQDKLHYVVVTGIIVKDGKFLIVKRSPKEKAFPGLWTVPGGKLRKSDYASTPKDTSDHWYNVLENLLRREVKEEVGLKIKNIRYLLSLVYIRSDGWPTIVISLYYDYAGGEIKLSPELTDYAWVSAGELKDFKLVAGLREEIEMVDKALKGKSVEQWTGKYDNRAAESKRNGGE
jgi:8-oxo-dGTP diphosphatase